MRKLTLSKIIGYFIAVLYVLVMAPMVFISYVAVGAIFELFFLIKNAIKQVKRTKVEADLYLEEWEQHYHDKF